MLEQAVQRRVDEGVDHAGHTFLKNPCFSINQSPTRKDRVLSTMLLPSHIAPMRWLPKMSATTFTTMATPANTLTHLGKLDKDRRTGLTSGPRQRLRKDALSVHANESPVPIRSANMAFERRFRPNNPITSLLTTI